MASIILISLIPSIDLYFLWPSYLWQPTLLGEFTATSLATFITALLIAAGSATLAPLHSPDDTNSWKACLGKIRQLTTRTTRARGLAKVILLGNLIIAIAFIWMTFKQTKEIAATTLYFLTTTQRIELRMSVTDGERIQLKLNRTGYLTYYRWTLESMEPPLTITLRSDALQLAESLIISNSLPAPELSIGTQVNLIGKRSSLGVAIYSATELAP